MSEQVVNVGAELTSQHFMKTRKESSGKTWNFLASTLGKAGWSTPLSGHFTPGNETWCPLYRRLGVSRVPAVPIRKILPTLGLEPRRLQHAVSLYNKATFSPGHRVGSCPVACGRPGPVFGPVVQYFLACGGGRVSQCCRGCLDTRPV